MAGQPVLRIAHGFGNGRERVAFALQERVDAVEADVRLRRGRLWLAHGRALPIWPCFVAGSFPLGELPPMVAGKCGLLLDLKSPRMKGNRRRFVEALAAALRAVDEPGSVRLCGDWPLLDEMRSVAPELRTYYSVADRRRWRALLRRLRNDGSVRGVSMKAGLFDEPAARFLRDRNVEVFCWVIDDLAEARRVIGLGAGGIISDDLKLLAATGRT